MSSVAIKSITLSNNSRPNVTIIEILRTIRIFSAFSCSPFLTLILYFFLQQQNLILTDLFANECLSNSFDYYFYPFYKRGSLIRDVAI
jgi:hypothetical protein